VTTRRALGTIRGRLAAGVTVAAVIGCAALSTAWLRLDALREERTASAAELQQVSRDARQLRAAVLTVMTDGLGMRALDEARWLPRHLSTARAADTLRHALIGDPRLDTEERTLLMQLGRQLARVEVLLWQDRAARALGRAEFDELAFDAALAAEVAAGSRLVDRFADHVADRTARQVDEADAAFTRAVRLAVLAIAVAGVLALGVMLATLRAIVAPINRLAGAVLALGRGQLESAALDELRTTDEEFRPLHDAVRAARDQLRRLLERVRVEGDRNRAIVDTSLVAVLAVDAGGRILIANPAAVALTGRSREALVGALFTDVFAPDSLRIGVGADGTLDFADAMAHPRFSARIRMPGVRAFPAEVAVTALPVGGLPQWAIFVHDLTDKHVAQRALEEARAAAESASRAKSAFLARMSHELRTPLNSIIGFTRIVRKSKDTHLADRDRLFLERVQAGGEHLLTLVNDILDLSRIEAGKVELVLEPVDVAQLAREVLPLFESQVVERPVALELDLPDGAAMVTGDVARLRQVLVNLLGNAVKFTPRGTVTVRVRADAGGAAQSIAVEDTGIGIALDRQARIFDAFEQADGETGHRYGGTGLGLAISRMLAEQMGCSLAVQSMPGRGSTFTLAFRAPAVTRRTPAGALRIAGAA
jgi:PAS domain S-box-containing protein